MKKRAIPLSVGDNTDRSEDMFDLHQLEELMGAGRVSATNSQTKTPVFDREENPLCLIERDEINLAAV